MGRTLKERLQSLSPTERSSLEARLPSEAVLFTGPLTERRERSTPFTLGQTRLWLGERLHPGCYNVGYAARMREFMDPCVVEQALCAVAHAHPILKARIQVLAGVPHLVAEARWRGTIRSVSLRDLSESDASMALRHVVDEFIRRPFADERDELVRVGLIEVPSRGQVLVLSLHHAVCDHWSMRVLSRDFERAYRSIAQREEPGLAGESCYASYAAWLSEATFESERSYWRQQLKGSTGPADFPKDVTRHTPPIGPGAFVRIPFGRDWTTRAFSACSEYGCSPFVVAFAAFLLLVRQYTGARDLCICIRDAGRGRLELEEAVGFFANVLPIRVKVNDSHTLSEFVACVAYEAAQAYDHREMPFERILSEAAEGLKPDLARLMMTEYYAPPPNSLDGNLPFEHSVFNGATHCDLELALMANEVGWIVDLTYSTEVFTAASAKQIAEQYRQLLSLLVERPAHRVAQLSRVAPTLRAQLDLWNRTQGAHEFKRSVADWFEARVVLVPDAIAVQEGSEQTSFAALNCLANMIAHELVSSGISVEDRVAVCVEPGVYLLAALLAVWKVGAAYVPLEPMQPENRLRAIASAADSKLCLVSRPNRDRMAGPCVVVEDVGVGKDIASAANPARPPFHPSQAAYVMFTSGSTAEPKGVVVEAAQVLNALQAHWGALPFEEGDRIAQRTTPTFAPSVRELFGGLLQGYPVVVLGSSVVESPQRLRSAIRRDRVTRLNVVPSHMVELVRGCTDGPLNSLNLVIVLGEPLSRAAVNAFRAHLPNTILANNYGSTETNDIALAVDVNSIAYESSCPLGRPIANTQLYVIDPEGERVPPLAAGELHVGAWSLPRGYLNDPVLSALKLVPDPHSGQPGARLFRTGDLVAMRSDGWLRLLGRADHVVKVRGCRVELGEVEASLAQLVGVDEGVVVPRSADDTTQLIAVFTGSASSLQLRRALRERLPSYMVPSRFVRVIELPRTRTGKIDRGRVSAYLASEAAEEERQSRPRRELERMSQLWCDVLRVAKVEPSDNFFDLGGDSLLMMKLISRAKSELDVELRPEAIVLGTLESCVGQSPGDVES